MSILPAALTVANLLSASAQRNPDSVALLAPGRKSLSYKSLYTQIEDTVEVLNTMGIGRNDRVALVINDSANLITAFMAVASGATCTTLNPNSTRSEYESLFARLNIKCLIYQADGENTVAVVETAKGCHVKLVELAPIKDAEAGLFTLSGKPGKRPTHTGWAYPEEVVMLTMSSGTTGTPKIIPRTQASYSSRALREAEVISVTPADRLLNVMPLFHSAGMNHVFRSLVVGSSIVCLPEFEVVSFYQALETYRPTWFSAVATICQAILAQADNYESIIANHSLRFIRAGSMALPPAVMNEMERRFKVPVLQAYSGSETGNIASNRLPPFVRKAGSVGTPLGLEVMIVDDALNKVQNGQSGEIVVKGSSVFEGYENDPQANAQSFFEGWFRTGDLGYFDEDGYLFISGRIKEVINRGGQKLSPNEVEAVLLEHPDVQAAAAFGIPDSQLGEEVAAAVVLRANRKTQDTNDATVSALQTFVAQRLVAYKVPRHIVIVDAIPLNAIGKIDRKGLAKLILPPSTLGSDSGAAIEKPGSSQTEIESSLVRLWAEVLQIPETRIGIHDSFQSLGGVSLSAARLVFKVQTAFGINISIVDFFNAPTITVQAEIVEQFLQRGSASVVPSSLIPIKADGSRPPLYCLHALKGGVYMYREFIPFLDPQQPIYGLQAVGFDDGKIPFDRVDAMADYHVQQIKAVQSKGPYFLCGYSFGGRLALEVGRRLRAVGHRDVYVLIIDDHLSASQFPHQIPLHRFLEKVGASRLYNMAYGMFGLPQGYRLLYIRQKLKNYNNYVRRIPFVSQKPDWELEDDLLPASISAVKRASKRAAIHYILRPYDGPIVYLRAANDEMSITVFRALPFVAHGPFKLIDVPGHHFSIMRETAHIQRVAFEIQQWLDTANNSPLPV